MQDEREEDDGTEQHVFGAVDCSDEQYDEALAVLLQLPVRRLARVVRSRTVRVGDAFHEVDRCGAPDEAPARVVARGCAAEADRLAARFARTRLPAAAFPCTAAIDDAYETCRIEAPLDRGVRLVIAKDFRGDACHHRAYIHAAADAPAGALDAQLGRLGFSAR